jgi:hypothetical protein
MNKKLWIGFVVVFVLVLALDYIINNYLMMSTYAQVSNLWRPMEEMKWGLIVVCQLFFAFFFTLIFSKGYEAKGVWEGVRYGFYVSMMVHVPGAYMTYATMPVPYSLALQWFLYGSAETIIAGIALALVFKKKKEVAAAPAA